jgi:hypothetical protein
MPGTRQVGQQSERSAQWLAWDRTDKGLDVSLLPDAASFHELVQDCFLAYRGAGLMLSPLDVELVDRWAADGVPFEVVARGIRRAAEAMLFDARAGQTGPRSLRACRRDVDAEIKKHRGRSAGKGEQPNEPPAEPLHLKRHGRVRVTLRKLARASPELSPGVERLIQRHFAAPPQDSAEATAREELLDLLLVRLLPFGLRLPVLRQARQMTEEAAGLSRRARKLSLRFHRGALVRRRLELPAYW